MRQCFRSGRTPIECIAELGVSTDRGFSSEKAASRLLKHGPNNLERHAPPSIWKLVLEQFNDTLARSYLPVPEQSSPPGAPRRKPRFTAAAANGSERSEGVRTIAEAVQVKHYGYQLSEPSCPGVQEAIHSVVHGLLATLSPKMHAKPIIRKRGWWKPKLWNGG